MSNVENTFQELFEKKENIEIMIDSIKQLDSGIYEKYNISLVESVKKIINDISEELNKIPTLDVFKKHIENSKIPMDRIERIYQGKLDRISDMISRLCENMKNKNWIFEYNEFKSFQNYINHCDRESDEYKTSYRDFGNIELKEGYSLLKIKLVVGINALLKKEFINGKIQILIVDMNDHKVVLSLNTIDSNHGNKLLKYTNSI